MRIISTTVEIRNKIGSIDSPGLARCELTPDGKRWQLWGLGIKGADADRIIGQLYAAQWVAEHG